MTSPRGRPLALAPEALATFDAMWTRGASREAIREKLAVEHGVYLTLYRVWEMAERRHLRRPDQVAAERASIAAPWAPEVARAAPEPPREPVERKRYPVPPGGYRTAATMPDWPERTGGTP